MCLVLIDIFFYFKRCLYGIIFGMLKKPPPPALMSMNGDVSDTARYSRLAILEVFERIGGVDRLAEVADENPKWFFEKMFRSTVQPEKIEVSKEKTVAELLEELDRKMIDVTPRRIDADTGEE